MTSYDKTNIPLVTALELSVAIHDRYGFTSKSTSDRATDSGKESNLDAKGNPIPNSARLYRQLFPSAKVAESEREKFEITPEHVEMAREIRETLQGFSFKAIERELTNFEQQVLSVVNSDTITHKDLGRIASFPNVYERKISQDAWEERESELARNSEFVGEVLHRAEFDVVIENVRYLSRTESYLICASESGKNIIKFFVPERRLDDIAEGDTIKLTGYIKKQEVSKYHGGSETVINRVKFL
jgi:hypothetical protein